MSGPHRILRVDCPDRPGLIHAITGVLSRHGVNIIGNDEFVDSTTSRFFMRTEFVDGDMREDVRLELASVLPEGALVTIGGDRRPRIVVMATREHHCLGELLLRHAHGELGAAIAAVVSNRDDLRALTDRFGVPFFHVPHEGLTREAHERAILDVIERHDVDHLVLAKYMRVLSTDFIGRYPNRIVNIHHSFLPAFVGANPYRQAFERGVKIIGATAHFVTEALDEGPIIAQDVVTVDHSYRADEMARAGRDVEKIVLARALELVFDERVFLTGNRTIVFD
jgi:formyltetrahydrofolate deformylase